MPEYSPDFPPPVTAQPPPFNNSPINQTQQSADQAPPSGVNPPTASTDTTTDTDTDWSVVEEAAQNSDVVVTATSLSGGGTAIVATAGAVKYVTGRAYEVCFFAPRVERTTASNNVTHCHLTLNNDGATSSDPWGQLAAAASAVVGGPVFLRSRFVGAGVAHVFSVVAYAGVASEWTVGVLGDQIQIYTRYLT